MALPHTDTFDSGDGTNLETHNADYNVFFGSMEINDNSAMGNAGSGSACLESGDTYANNQYAQAIVDYSGTNDLGILISRFTTSFNGYGYGSEGTGGATTSERYDAGVPTTIIADATDWADTDDVRIEANGTTIEIFLNSSSDGSTTDATFSSGDPGMLFGDDDQGMAFDSINFGNLPFPVSQSNAPRAWGHYHRTLA